MFTWDYNLFIGDDTTETHVGFAASDNIFIIGEAHSSDEGKSLKDTLDHIKTSIEVKKPASLDSLLQIVNSDLKQIGTSLISFAAAYVIESVLYVVTKGKGEVVVARDGHMQKLLDGDNTASGFIKENDYFLLANSTFRSKVNDTTLQKLLFNTKPQEVIEIITPELKGTDNVGMIALFMQAIEPDEDEVIEDDQYITNTTPEEQPALTISDPQYVQSPGSTTDQSQYTQEQPTYPESMTPSTQFVERSRPADALRGKFTTLMARMKSGSSRGRKLTFVMVIVLLLVLSWSVISGNARREKARFIAQVAEQQVIVDAKIVEAKELAGLNTQKSLQLLDESREIVTTLELEAKQKDLASLPELADMSSSITSAEQSIKKQEAGQYEEYYDLNLIAKGASATTMYNDGEQLAMLDSKAGKVYVLDIAEKSVETYSSKDIKKATSVALHRDEPYVYGKSIGIVKFISKSETEPVIAADSELGSVTDFWMYNGNIYLLDAGSDEIYKYLVAEEGYSEKRTYFGEGQTIILGEATSMAIDSSIYIAAGSKTMKYTGGARDTFSVSIPDETESTFDHVYTDRDIDEVYFMDTQSQRIFVADKDGEFKKQISASILKGADDIVVDIDKGILVLSGSTLYLIEE